MNEYKFSDKFVAWSLARVAEKEGSNNKLTCKGCQMAPFSCSGCSLREKDNVREVQLL